MDLARRSNHRKTGDIQGLRKWQSGFKVNARGALQPFILLSQDQIKASAVASIASGQPPMKTPVVFT